MSKTEAYSWIGAVIGGIVGLLIALMLEPELVVTLNAVIGGSIIGAIMFALLGLVVILYHSVSAIWNSNISEYSSEGDVAHAE